MQISTSPASSGGHRFLFEPGGRHEAPGNEQPRSRFGAPVSIRPLLKVLIVLGGVWSSQASAGGLGPVDVDVQGAVVFGDLSIALDTPLELASALLCEAGVRNFIFGRGPSIVLDDAAIESMAKGASAGCRGIVHVHHDTQRGAVPRGLESEAVVLHELALGNRSRFDLADAIAPNGRVDIVALPVSSAISKICPEAPHSDGTTDWMWIEPWRPGRQGISARMGDISYVNLRAVNAFAESEKFEATAYVMRGERLDELQVPRTHYRDHWARQGVFVLEFGDFSVAVSSRIGPSMQELASRLAGATLWTPAPDPAPGHEDLCNYRVDGRIELAPRAQAEIEWIAGRCRDLGIDIFMGEEHGRSHNIRLLAAILRGASRGPEHAPIHLFQETEGLERWEEGHHHRVSRLLQLHRINNRAFHVQCHDSRDELDFVESLQDPAAVSIHEVRFADRSKKFLANALDHAGFALYSLGLSHVTGRIEAPNLVRDFDGTTWYERGRAIPTDVETEQGRKLYEWQRASFDGWKQALAKGRAAALFVNDQMFTVPGGKERFVGLMAAEGHVAMTLRMGHADETATFVVTAGDLRRMLGGC